MLQRNLNFNTYSGLQIDLISKIRHPPQLKPKREMRLLMKSRKITFYATMSQMRGGNMKMVVIMGSGVLCT